MPLDTPRSFQPEVGQATAYLTRQPGVRRLWLFGSVAKGRPVDWRSDLDLAVEGLAAEDLGRIWSEVVMLIRCPVDLVRWEEASPALREEIQRWGQLLYEA